MEVDNQGQPPQKRRAVESEENPAVPASATATSTSTTASNADNPAVTSTATATAAESNAGTERADVAEEKGKEEEDDDDEGPDSFFLAREKELQQEEQTILDGTHSELSSKVVDLQKEKEKVVHRASVNRELQIQEAEALYKFELQAADDSFNTSRDAARQRMLAEISESMRNLEQLKQGASEEQVRVSTRKLRSKTTTKGPNGSGAGSANNNNNNGHVELSDIEKSTNRRGGKGSGDGKDGTLVFAVEEEDIVGDLKAIYKDWKQAADKRMSKADIGKTMVKYENGKLQVKEQVLEKGSFVVVNDAVTKQDLYGTITSINKDEVLVKLVDNSRTLILMRDLRSGRCSIERDSDY